jgi:alkylation response protein AidB-like acyl-CoA dehydrogenase
VQLAAGREAGSYVLSGTKTAVEGGGEAEWFLLTARDEEDLVHFLVPRDTPGLTVTPLEGLDMTRRFARLDLDGLRIDDGDRLDGAGRDALEWLSDLAVLVQLGEMVGAMQWALDTTLEWSFNRYSFGRPLASYQEIKHRFADMKMWLEASYAITDQAAQAMDDGRPERAEIVSTAKLYVGTQGVELMQDCVQLHGGIGVTFDLDLHLFLRRVTTDVALFGLPSEHAARIGRLIHSGRAE